MEYPLDPFFVRQLREGRCVLFVGAGLSAAAGLPDWERLLRTIIARAPAGATTLDTAGFEALVTRNRLLDAAGRLRAWLGPAVFQEALRAALAEKPLTPTATHRLLTRFRFRAIVTTNFDQLIEQSFGDALPVATHCDAGHLARYLGTDTPFLYKVHGDIARGDTIVLTADDFAQMVWGNPVFQKSLSALLLTSPVLFAGYSHSDPDFDLLFREHVRLFGAEGARRYALLRVVSDEERMQVEVLREKAIQVLPYRDHAEVPAFFEWLSERVRGDDVQISSTPPQEAAPGLGQFRALRARRPLRPAGATRRTVVVIPGIGGSQLSVRKALLGERRVWLDMLSLAMGAMAQLDLGESQGLRPRVRATDLLARFYSVLVMQLARRCEVLAFPYDWREDYWRLADHLRDFLLAEVGEGSPCDLVAHAEGGLLARAFIAENADVWDGLQVGATGGRLIMLGTPNHGSFAALLTLLGEQSTVQLLARLDLRHNREEMRRIFASFPSLYQTLPSPLKDAAWTALYQRASYGDLEVSQPLLEAGAAFHRAIAEVADPLRMVCILGQGHATVAAVENPARLDRSPRWASTLAGDGNVPHALSLLDKNGVAVPAYVAGCAHGELANDMPVAQAVAEILERGETSILAQTPAVVR